MKRILHVVGARPNFMKIAPIMREMTKYPKEFEQMLVHTGQHYDEQMSQIFFDELEMPLPDVNLEVGSGSHAWQTAEIMQRFEPVLLEYQPDWVLVPGDVNSTVACALVASKLGVNVAHVEAGLRSLDRTMPEELNRIVTDHLSDLLFTTEESGNENLLREGISDENIRFVGNTMIDTLVHLLPKAQSDWHSLQRELELDGQFILVTLHRPSNVDDPKTLRQILTTLVSISEEHTLIFPMHPRTQQRVADLNLRYDEQAFRMISPQGYLDFLALQDKAALVITDSGGIQEETTYLGTPCLTIRPNTERPITVTKGTNQLVEADKVRILSAIEQILSKHANIPENIPLWDGRSSLRIVDALCKI